MKINPLPGCQRRKMLPFSDHLPGVIIPCLFLFFLIACSDKNRQQPDLVELTWNFTPGHEGWSGDFAEYPFGEEIFYDLLFEPDTLPLPLDQNQQALKLSGNNRNSDLFMFAKKRITGLTPNTVYFATFTIEFATSLPGDNTIKDSPGKLVYIAAGAVSFEPVKVNGDNNVYGMNIGKFNLDQNGEHMVVLGDFTNGTNQEVYALKNVENENPFRCLSNEKGELWVIIGIDSALPDYNTAYINTVKVELY